MSAARLLLVLVVGLGSVAACFAACSGPAAAPLAAYQDASDASILPDSSKDPDDVGPDADDPIPPRPAGLPAGWELSTAYRRQCGFYLPSKKEAFPEPIEWGPCSVDMTGHSTADGGASDDAGRAGCRETKVTWRPGAQADMNVTHGAVDSSGRVLLTQIRVTADGAYYVTGEADGPVRSATFEGRRDTCRLYPESMSQSGTLLRVHLGTSFDTTALLLDTGSPNHRASVVQHEAGNVPAYYIAEERLFRFDGTIAAAPLTTMRFAPLPPWQERVGQEGFVGTLGDTLLFFGSQGTDSTISAYSANDTFVRVVDDKVPSTRDSAFGTDGKDAAWLHATGCISSGACDSIELRTAPFSLSPLVGRGVRSIATRSTTMSSVVACGRVAIESNEAIRIVDLATGRAWELPKRGMGYSFVGDRALALTCNEIFLTTNLTAGSSVRYRATRIRLDALGPGALP